MDFLQGKTFEEMKNDDPIKVTSDPIKQQLYQAIVQDGTLNHAEYAEVNMSPVYWVFSLENYFSPHGRNFAIP